MQRLQTEFIQAADNICGRFSKESDLHMNGSKNPVRLPDPDLERRKRGRKVSLILLFFLAALFVLDTASIEKMPRLCIWYGLTGTDCPFCGLVRSCFALAHGSFTRAFQYHPFGPVVFSAVILVLAGSLYAWVTGKAFPALAWLERNSRKTALISGIILLAWWLTRLLIFKSSAVE